MRPPLGNAGTPRNLLTNPGFEGSIAPWQASGPSQETVANACPTIGCHDGTDGLMIPADSVAASSKTNAYTLLPSLTPGVPYTFQIWAYAPHAGDEARVFDGYGDTPVQDVSASGGWTLVTMTFTPTTSAQRYAGLYAVAGAGNATSDLVYYADAALYQGTPVAQLTSPPTATPSATPTPTATPAGPIPGNIVANPDFEAASGTQLAGWALNIHAPAATTLTRDMTVYHSGTTSARVDAPSVNGAAYGVRLQQSVAIIAGQSYSLTIWLRASAPSTVPLGLQQNGGNDAIYTQQEAIITQANTWLPFAFNFYNPYTDGGATLHIDEGDAVGSVWVDDVSLTPLDDAGTPLPTPVAPPPNSYIRGVNVQGGTPNLCCGSAVFANGAQLDWLKAHGWTHFREQIAWKQLQPTPYGPLDGAYLRMMDDEVQLAAARGEQIAFNPWDRENGSGQGSVPLGQLVDLWQKIVRHDAANPSFMAGIWGWDLLNEPDSALTTDFAQDAWNVTYVPALIRAIRQINTTKTIFAPTSAGGYGIYWNRHLAGLPFHDPANNLVYEAHFYFDTPPNGTYDTTTGGLTPPSDAHIGVKRAADFLAWCGLMKVTCDAGEYGVPGGWNNTGQATCSGTGNQAIPAGWNTILDTFLAALDQHNVWGTAWEAGPFGDIDDIGPTCDGTTRQSLPVYTAHLSATGTAPTVMPIATPPAPMPGTGDATSTPPWTAALALLPNGPFSPHPAHTPKLLISFDEQKR